jgi:TonB family protein
MLRLQLIALVLFAQFSFGFQSNDDTLKKVAPLKGGIVAPAVTYKLDPKYTDGARDARITGTVVLQLVIDEQGRATQIEVLSPLGYGLDENAIDAVAQWRWRPATKDDKPVKVYGTVEVNFNLLGVVYDKKAEKQRTDFNVALRAVQKGEPNKVVLQSIKELASEKYAPGMYLYGSILEDGRGVTADPNQGFRLIQESADKKFGPALYEVAVARLQGKYLDKDLDKGMELMHDAAKLGSQAAQMFLGQAYEKGDGIPLDRQKSRQYFRLCAAAGDSVCEFRLGKSLLEYSDNPSRDYVQSIAWLQLSSDSGNKEAATILEQQAGRLTPAQAANAKRVKTQLVHQP